MILGSFIAINTAILATRAINTKVDDVMRGKILNEGLYHVTSEDAANKIMDSEYIRPSGIGYSLGSKKCFFFAGPPSYKDLSSNCASEATKYEFKAVKVMPNKEELCNFRQRSLNDDSITYKGRCDLPEKRAKIVDLVLDLDKDGKIFTREKTEEEIENYTPSKELVDKMTEMNQNTLKVLGKSYFQEYMTVGSKLKEKFIKFKDKMLGSNRLKLNEGKSEKNILEKNIPNNFIGSSDKRIESELKENTYSIEESINLGIVQEESTDLKKDTKENNEIGEM